MDAEDRVAVAASAFSTSLLTEISADIPPSQRLRSLARLGMELGASTLGSCFDVAHEILRRQYRSEYFYKNAVVSKLVFGRHSPSTASALLELGVGSSVADVVVLNGTSTAYEIKTDLDDFARLPGQLLDYTRAFERVYVVASARRAPAVLSQVDDSIGVIALQRNGALSVLRMSDSHAPTFDNAVAFEMLRQKEALSVLSRSLGYAVDVPTGDIWARSRELFSSLPMQTARAEFHTELRRRGSASVDLVAQDSFPKSLRALAYATQLSRRGRLHLATGLQKPAALFGGY